ncbi:PAS domain-containing sensor histidine kinase [soil metagenome]
MAWDWLLNPSGLTPHGFCLSWAPGLIGLHVVSDVIIGLAYFSIPLAIASFMRRRGDIQYGWIAYLFVAFILACGTTHLLAILTLWVPAYGVEGLIKALTAVLSIATAAILWTLIPRALALPSAAELERRVAERTAELTEALRQRDLSQQALIRSEEQFRASFEAAAVGKMQTDPASGLVLRANRAFARMLGYEPEDLVGLVAWDLIAREDRDVSVADHTRVEAGNSDVHIAEKRYVRRDGTLVWGRVSATVIRDADGRPTLTIGVIEDIDDRHKAQAALQAAKMDLEQMLGERTNALAQRDLLLREVYHRVKNNLQMIDSFIVMQARLLSDPVAAEGFANLRARVFALGLVHHQLMGSKDLETFDIAPFLGELSRQLLASGGASDISLTVDAAPLHVGLDFAIPLGLIVTELVTNSLKHAFPEGEGAIQVTLDIDDDGMAALIVTDNGQGHDVTGGAPKTSLGATIIRGLVAQLGGSLTIDGTNGTRSQILIPNPEAA